MMKCPACQADPGQPCIKNDGTIRKTEHGPRRYRPDRDWPGPPGSPMNHPNADLTYLSMYR